MVEQGSRPGRNMHSRGRDDVGGKPWFGMWGRTKITDNRGDLRARLVFCLRDSVDWIGIML